MQGNLASLAVQIVRFVDEDQPGWVQCEFTDADDRRHTVVDKVPMFTSESLWVDSKYPTSGSMVCEVLARWRDAAGRELVRISADYLHGVAEGTEFIVSSEQLSPLPPDAPGGWWKR